MSTENAATAARSSTDCYAFRQHVQGRWQVDPLTPYAWEYHERCEAFDRTVCSKIVNGVAQPATSEEVARVNENAKRVKEELYDRIRRELGPHEVSLLQRAINAVSRDFERSLRIEA